MFGGELLGFAGVKAPAFLLRDLDLKTGTCLQEEGFETLILSLFVLNEMERS